MPATLLAQAWKIRGVSSKSKATQSKAFTMGLAIRKPSTYRNSPKLGELTHGGARTLHPAIVSMTLGPVLGCVCKTRCRCSIETDILHELAELDRPRIVLHRIFANCGFWPDRVQYCDLGCRGHDTDLGCRGHDTVVRDMKWITHFVSSLSFPGDDATRHSEDYGAE